MIPLLFQSGLARGAWSIFWYLCLAHFLGDYPLQTDWIAQNKTKFGVLLLHVAIHFLVLWVVFYPTAAFTWPFLLALAGIHFGIDALKNWSKVHRPAWVIWPYVVDQLLHLMSLAAVAALIRASLVVVPVALPVSAAIVGSGLVLVTFVWMITERVVWGRSGLSAAGAQGPWQRLAIRAGFFALCLLARQALVATGLMLGFHLPYSTSPAGKRALLTDIAVTVVVAGLASLALSV